MATERQDVYTRITNTIVSFLEKGVRPWTKPWKAEYAGGRIARPLRHNGQPYAGINVLILWASAVEQGFTARVWMTFNQASELKAHVRKGEKGSLIVYANRMTRTEQTDTGEEIEREIPFLKGCTVFQRGTNRGTSRILLRATSIDPHGCRADCPCRRILREHRRSRPLRRGSGVLRQSGGPYPDAAARGLRECRSILHDPGA